MSRIATGTGDKGQTGLFDGTRVPKTHPLVRAYGDIDELDAALGVAAASDAHNSLTSAVQTVQRELFTLKADLATPLTASKKVRRIEKRDVAALDARIDVLEAAQPPLTHFIENGGTTLAANLHVARTIARRAERSTWEAHEAAGGLNPEALVYMNRLSDYLFLLARKANLDVNMPERIMKPLD